MTTPVVLDTNIVLDLWLYNDPATPALLAALTANEVQWVATQVMRDELERVLAYPHIVQRMLKSNITAEHILAQFDAHALIKPVAAKAPYTCKDPDDQKFIDLAVEQKATLYSKDKYVLALRNRLARLGIEVRPQFVRPHP